MKKTIVFDLDDTISQNDVILPKITELIKNNNTKANFIISSARDYDSILTVLRKSNLLLNHFSNIIYEDGFYCYSVENHNTNITGSYVEFDDNLKEYMRQCKRNRIVIFSEKGNFIIANSFIKKLLYKSLHKVNEKENRSD